MFRENTPTTLESHLSRPLLSRPPAYPCSYLGDLGRSTPRSRVRGGGGGRIGRRPGFVFASGGCGDAPGERREVGGEDTGAEVKTKPVLSTKEES